MLSLVVEVGMLLLTTHTHTKANFCQQDTYGLIFQTH